VAHLERVELPALLQLWFSNRNDVYTLPQALQQPFPVPARAQKVEMELERRWGNTYALERVLSGIPKEEMKFVGRFTFSSLV
jgi:hypothetical protein